MYLDAAVRGYDLVEVPTNKELRDSLSGKSLEELSQILLELKGSLHNHTDTDERHRVLRAIEIETYTRSEEARIQREKMTSRPDIRPFIVGTTFPRDILRSRAGKRLRERFDQGMIDEVKKLHDSGVSWERLERLGLEYKFLAQYLQGKISSYDELFRSLHIAIGQFIKRQETWYRGMERKGTVIHWLKYDGTAESASASNRAQQIVSLLKNEEHTFNL
jgi:tRNA dimethylallyltransferase